MPTLLTFGDSNTYGTPPMKARPTMTVRDRFGEDVRWPCVTRAELGPDWTLVEEGLPGRTTQHDDPIMGAHMNGRAGLRIALESHGPIDVLTLMLGTNDAKSRFAPEAWRITAGMAGLLDIALSPEMQARHGGYQVLLICPPAVREIGPLAAEFLGAEAAFDEVPRLYAALAAARSIGFLDAGQVIATSTTDGIHFEPGDHPPLGRAVAEAIRALL
ncbi:MAG: SGNH/GDSL hydrolase family protein [Rhodobacteraceae bacterium]|nr:SGNH/GDSL hydrolase family protein [Paracoccaceae bacterium]